MERTSQRVNSFKNIGLFNSPRGSSLSRISLTLCTANNNGTEYFTQLNISPITGSYKIKKDNIVRQKIYIYCKKENTNIARRPNKETIQNVQCKKNHIITMTIAQCSAY